MDPRLQNPQELTEGELTAIMFAEDEARHNRWRYLTEMEVDNPRLRLKTREDRVIMEKLLDQTARQLHEETSTSSVQAYQRFAYPLIRRVYPQLVSRELVSIQPMDQPTGLIFYLDAKRTDTGGRLDQLANFDETMSTTTEGGAVKEVEFTIGKATVTAIEKKLKAIWTIEAEQDIQAYHGLDAQSELMTIISEQIAREIDGLILLDLIATADIASVTTAGNTNWDTTPPAGDTSSGQKREYRETIWEAFIDSMTLVVNKRYRYPTWVISSPSNISRLMKLEGFSIDPDFAKLGGEVTTGTRVLVGTVKSMLKVYVDPWWPSAHSTKYLLGYKGNSWLETGFVYSPYILSYVTPPFVDPDTFKTKRGMMSRFAKQKVEGNFYSTVTLITT